MRALVVSSVSSDWRWRRLRPKDVFIPNSFPVERNNVYAARQEAERALQQGLDRQRLPLVYGEYGVGKTTLSSDSFSHRLLAVSSSIS